MVSTTLGPRSTQMGRHPSHNTPSTSLFDLGGGFKSARTQVHNALSLELSHYGEALSERRMLCFQNGCSSFDRYISHWVLDCHPQSCVLSIWVRHMGVGLPLDRRVLHAGASKMVDFHLTDTYCIGSWIAIPSHVFCPSAFDHGCWIAIPNGN